MHLRSKNEQNDTTAKSVLTLLVKNASFLPENTITLRGSGKETREPEAKAGIVNAAMIRILKSIRTWRRIVMKLEDRLRKVGKIIIFLRA